MGIALKWEPVASFHSLSQMPMPIRANNKNCILLSIIQKATGTGQQKEFTSSVYSIIDYRLKATLFGRICQSLITGSNPATSGRKP
jgi:hypothetical protein